jgi:hypothetical protein
MAAAPVADAPVVAPAAITPTKGFRAWIYTDDSGTIWRRRAKQEYVEQLDGAGPATLLGGVPATSQDADSWPSNWTPRRVVVSNAAQGTRQIVAYEETAPLYTGTATAIELRSSDGTVAVYTRIGTKPETRGRLIGAST